MSVARSVAEVLRDHARTFTTVSEEVLNRSPGYERKTLPSRPAVKTSSRNDANVGEIIASGRQSIRLEQDTPASRR